MKKLIEINHKITNDTSACHNLVLQVSLDTLLEELGQPYRIGSLDQKTQLHWAFYNNRGTITVYDWKERKPVYNIIEWNIGSKGLSKDEVINFFKSKNLKYQLAKIMVDGFSVYRKLIFA